jgi:hypothetical protein
MNLKYEIVKRGIRTTGSSIKIIFTFIFTMQPSTQRHDNDNNPHRGNEFMMSASTQTGGAADRRRRRRRRFRSSPDRDDNKHCDNDPYTNLPLQAMKRLRVDANDTICRSNRATTTTTTRIDDDNDDIISFVDDHNDNDVAVDMSTSCPYRNDVPMRSTNPYEFPSATSTTTTNSMFSTSRYNQRSEGVVVREKSKYNDPYYCYQRHQHQETGQDTDGWNGSPEPLMYDRMKPSQQQRHTNGTASSLQYHNTVHHSVSSSFMHRHSTTGSNTYTTPSILRNANKDDDDDDDEMDYHSVNHILGNLHFERQQRMAAQQEQQHRVPSRDDYYHGNMAHQSTNDRQLISIPTEMSSSFIYTGSATLPPPAAATTMTTPLNTRMLRHQRFMGTGGGISLQSPPPQQLPLSSTEHNHIYHNNNYQYQTPPPPPAKPTKRRVLQLYTNSKLG